jgi:hypothetical protein
VEKRGRRIADRGEADAGDARTGGWVVNFIHTARLEAAVQDDARPSGSVGKPPRRTRNDGRLVPIAVAHGQRRGWIVRRRRRIVRQVSWRDFRASLVGDEREADPAGHVGGGRGDPQHWRFDVELPADPHDGVAILHQEAVAEIRSSRRVLTPSGAIEPTEDALAPAVGDLEEQGAVAACGIHRLQHVEIGGEVHASIASACHRAEIGDGLVVWVGGIECELDGPRQLFVRADGPERLAVSDDGS